MAAFETHRRGETALRLLHSLGPQHEMYFYREIRKRCMDHVVSMGLPLADRGSAAAELLSEVMAKLLGVTGPKAEDDPLLENELNIDPAQPSFQTNSQPEEDERVRWLLQEVGRRRALSHRFEDIRRRRWGRAQGPGYRMVQISSLGNPGPENDRDEDILARQEERDNIQDDREDPHHDRDIQRAWSGLLAMASSRYKPHEDVRKLLELLARDSEVQAGFGVEWPVRKIVDALNFIDPDPPWTDDRIENAKKRLRNWIGGIKREYGFDQTDLMALFARCGRDVEKLSNKGGA